MQNQCRSEGWVDWAAAQGADEGGAKRPEGARKRAGQPLFCSFK
jgi:hypothetical protein